MPPLKALPIKKSSVSSENSFNKTMSTRSTKMSSSLKKENIKDLGTFPKRKAVSPIKGNALKRSALGNITNAVDIQITKTSVKKVVSTVAKTTVSTTTKLSLPGSTISKPLASNNSKSMLPPLPKSRLTLPLRPSIAPSSNTKLYLPGNSVRSVPATTVPVKSAAATKKPPTAPRPAAKQSPTASKKPAPVAVPANKCKVTAKPKCMVSAVPSSRRSSGRRSTLESSDGSLYMSALSEVLDEEVSTSDVTSSVPAVDEPLPKPDIDIDEEYAGDPFQCATYAYDIFEYLKSREPYFQMKDYMEMQTSLSQYARSILVDWMVEIQENFELNHETLYLGVKLVDAYLSKIKVSKQSLQLVGATAMFIAAKYDERIPPAIEDFLYVCDGAYRRKDITKMEVNILRVTNFELGFPLSYRFLRRYARCAKIPMPLLTLARYILEHCLMDYSTIFLSDSKMAAAALYISFKMKNEDKKTWDNTLIYFTGYKVSDFIEIAHIMNNCLHQKPKPSLTTVRNKYSHKIFYEVAKIPLVSNENL